MMAPFHMGHAPTRPDQTVCLGDDRGWISHTQRCFRCRVVLPSTPALRRPTAVGWSGLHLYLAAGSATDPVHGAMGPSTDSPDSICTPCVLSLSPCNSRLLGAIRESISCIVLILEGVQIFCASKARHAPRDQNARFFHLLSSTVLLQNWRKYIGNSNNAASASRQTFAWQPGGPA